MAKLGSYAPRGLSDEEAAELLQLLRFNYLSPNTFPHVVKLVEELERWETQMKQAAAR